MVRGNLKLILLIFILVFAVSFTISFSSNFVSAACWQHTTQSNCVADTTATCNWKNDSWGAWCEELNCWGLWNQTGCQNTAISGKNCTWSAGSTNYYCSDVSCWAFAGTNQTTCENSSAGLSCSWESSCYSNGWNLGVDCWSFTTQSNCLNASGCAWGNCWEKGCSSYNANTTSACNAAKDWRGNNCTWDVSGSYCKERNCWDNTLYSNATACANAVGINCEWKWDSCQEKNCWSWDFTNESSCVNNTLNLSCEWTMGSYCSKKGCWNYGQSECQNNPKCYWGSWSSSGWCEEVQCWTWDSWSGGSQTECLGNSSVYGLNCKWENLSADGSSGWCFKDVGSVTCSNMTTERECMDTYYCWWQYADWNNLSQGGTCNDPGGWGLETNNSILIGWNPGCYIFDNNVSDCGNILGCDNSTAGQCSTNSTHSNANEINANGINCTMINSSTLCSNIPALSSCCSWNSTQCVINKLTTSCWDQMETPPAESCDDANNAEEESSRKSTCDQLSGTPWYMPCKWQNSTKMCSFKASDVFGNSSQNLVKIENKRNCEAAGGKWITENYCEENISVPVGRCEYKFDDEDNCNKVCFACEKKDSNGNPVNSTNAESACLGSTLGVCKFTADTNAPNSLGYCSAKQEWKIGIAGDCDTICGDCTYKGDPLNNDTTKKPNYYCSQSKANSANGGCKWISDNSTSTGGYCADKGAKTCENACDRCYTQTNCLTKGLNATGPLGKCKWDGTSDEGNCVANVGEDVEVCWDAVDNTNDGLIDCADPGCYSDSWCGFVEGDCFGWKSNTTCSQKGCEWTNDSWNPTGWCDFKGAFCWKYDTNVSTCDAQTNCKWTNGSGVGWCERDWSVAEQCFNLDRTSCTNPCTWTNDTWCDSVVASASDWCQNYGGWCDHSDFAPKNCWMYQSSSTECGAQAGCNWHIDEWSQPHCDVNWSGNCWQYYSNSTCTTAGCLWKNETWGSWSSAWCDSPMGQCWSSYTQTACEAVSGAKCSWKNETWGGSCQPACFNSTLSDNSTNCATVTGCYWIEENGWCEEEQMEGCSNSTSSANPSNCDSTAGCRWRNSGWCDPKEGGFSAGAIASGGGMGGSIGADCYKYDGNQSLCTNKTTINISCGWSTETNPRCEVNWNNNCWQYTSGNISFGCNATNNCWWYNASEFNMGAGGWCMNIMDQCWNNVTLQSDASACNNNIYCNASAWGGCQPTCFSEGSNTLSTCQSTTGCRWITGWCNSAGMNQMFDSMETGAPVPLGADACDGSETNQSSVDICGFGMKDMGDSYGFGINVFDFSNASICNKEKLSSFVMGMIGGTGIEGMGLGSFGNERMGDGNDTIKFFVYLDTDGSTTGSCSLTHNTSEDGYEFRFKYVSEWNVSKTKAVETFNAYKCENSKWKTTDIKLGVWKKKMCSEIGGGMIAVEKTDLSRFPTLYNSSSDMRVYVATAGATHNLSIPSDTAGPAWISYGSIDFEIASAFSYGTNAFKFEDILRKGFVQYEDCFNGIDDESDGAIDCNDWDCQYTDKCSNTGVNAPGYVDTSSPRVTGVKIEEYSNAALIIYDTSKPTNGTLRFYANDSTCLALNTTIYDAGILKNNTFREYKLWHSAYIYNSADSLSYALDNDTTYYYKLKVCDSGGKCAVSQCSSFITASSTKCPYCNFVTRIKTPVSWQVQYDVDQDGNYEHVQGQVCGPNAGMKTNYTAGMYVNIKLNDTTGTSAIEFINATLTMTGLNDKVRTISTSGSLLNGTTTDSSGNAVGYVGMISETRDKIIYNLHPEICRLIIPQGDGQCGQLWHCDSNGGNCTNRTSDATLLSNTSNTCKWQIPFCEFSMWASGQPGTPPTTTTTTTTSSGGGGGGSGGGGAATYTINAEQLLAGYTKELDVNARFKFTMENDTHYVTLKSLEETKASIEINSTLQTAVFAIGQEQKFELTDDNYYDISIKLNNITVVNNTATKADLTIKSIHEGITAEKGAEESITGETIKEEKITEPAELGKTYIWAIIAVVIIVIAIILWIIIKKKR